MSARSFASSTSARAAIWDDADFDDRVEALAGAPLLRDAVRMLGPRPSGEALARWNVFVLPSRQEAFPLSTLEAMAAGLPVIATAVGGIPEQMQHLETGVLVPPEDPGAVADWIVRLHDDPALREDLGRARARARAASVPAAPPRRRRSTARTPRRYTDARPADGGIVDCISASNRPTLSLVDHEQRSIERHNRAQIEYFERAGKHAMRPSDSTYVRRQVDRLDRVRRPRRPASASSTSAAGWGGTRSHSPTTGSWWRASTSRESLLAGSEEFDGGRYGIPLHCADVLDPPDELKGRFDAVVGFFTLHHLHDLGGCLRAMRDLARPGGRIVFLEPNPLNPLYYIQMLVVPGMSWSGDKGILNMRERDVFARDAGRGARRALGRAIRLLAAVRRQPPWGPRAEDTLERRAALVAASCRSSYSAPTCVPAWRPAGALGAAAERL